MTMRNSTAALLLSVCCLAACSDDTSAQGGGGSAAEGGGGSAGQPMVLTSSAFTEGEGIPELPFCSVGEVQGISPPLSWTPGPSGTMSYAIIMRRVDNGTGHWAIWDIPSASLALPQDVESAYMPSDAPGALQCAADPSPDNPGYSVPCAVVATRDYEFTLYAVPRASLGLDPMSVGVDAVEQEAQIDALAEATLSVSLMGA